MARMSVVSALRAAAPRCAGTQQRLFSHTAVTRKSHHVVTFTETSSTELDSLLNTLREQRILPMYLSPEERKKIYRERNYQKLKNDPPTVTIDGEVHKFYYTDKHKDLVEVRRTAIQAIRLMKTDEDWANLSRLLTGLHHKAKIHWWRPGRGDFPKLARQAGTQDRIFTIIECARQVDSTGFKLDDPELIAQIMYWVQWKAFAGFAAPSFEEAAAKAASRKAWPDVNITRKALLWADMVVDMLQLDAHQPSVPRDEQLAARRAKQLEYSKRIGDPNSVVAQPEQPAEQPAEQPKGFALRDDPMWILPQLHLAAALVVKHKLPEEEADGLRKRVTQLSNTLVKRWPAGRGLNSLPLAKDAHELRFSFLKYPNSIIREGALALSALDLAMGVVEPELAAELKSRRDATSDEVDNALSQPADKQYTGRLVHDILHGTRHALPTSKK
ncbi:hypothetical protein RB594_007301 [Gaeumannomyces avenae]